MLHWKMLKSSAKIFSTLSQTLPDDRPITAIQVVEHTEKCPEGFFPISRTHDQDQDADLWREHSIFMRKQGRYLCLSKNEGLPNHVVQEIAVVGDKELPPEGYSLLHRTADTELKAWRKRQLVYRLSHIKNTSHAITDIIVCSRLKQAPSGFTLAGEINGMTVCYKMGAIGLNIKNELAVGSPQLKPRAAPELPPKNIKSPHNMYPNIGDSNDDYEQLNPSYLQPSRPAPRPPGTTPLNGFSTLAAYNAIDGVPFVLHPKLIENKDSIGNKFQIPVIKKRSMLQIENDYAYDFKLERCA